MHWRPSVAFLLGHRLGAGAIDEILVTGVATGAIYGLLAIGLVVIFLGGRTINFAHGEVGTLVLFIASAVASRDWPWWSAAALAIATAAVIGVVFARLVAIPLAGSDAVTMAVASVGLLTVVVGVELYVFGGEPRFLPGAFEGHVATVGSVVFTAADLAAVSGLVGAASAVSLGLRKTNAGLALRAIADDPDVARLSGVPRDLTIAGAWVAGSILAAIAALLVEPVIGVFHPYSLTVMLVPALAAALIGGLRSPVAAAAGALFIGIIESAVARGVPAFSGAAQVAVLLAVLVVLLIRPTVAEAR